MAWACPLSAQLVDLGAVTIEELVKEGPLTQADVDLFVNFLEHSAQTMNKLPDKEIELYMTEMVTEFIKTTHANPVRLRYISEKIPYAVLIVTNNAGVFDPGETYLNLSDAEKTLISKNLAKLSDLLDKSKQKK
jgi:hypothetical protein